MHSVPVRDLHHLLASGLVWVPEGEKKRNAKEGAPSGVRRREGERPLPRSPAQHDSSAVPFGAAEIDSTLGYGGLRTGMLHEWAVHSDAQAPKSFIPPPVMVLAHLAGNALRGPPAPTSSCPATLSSGSLSSRYVVWIGRAAWPTPYLLAQTIGKVERSLFIDPPDRAATLWALDVALRSPAVAAVIADCRARVSLPSEKKRTYGIGAPLTLPLTRRLALAARESGAIGFFLCDERAFASPSMAASRWIVSSHPTTTLAPTFDLTLVRYKGAAQTPRRWILELGDRDEQEYSPLCVRVLPPMGDHGSVAEKVSFLAPTRRAAGG